MAPRAIIESVWLGDPRPFAPSPVQRRESDRLSDPFAALAIAGVAAMTSALLYALAAAVPWLWPCALLAPLPILATAPEIRTATAAQIAFIAYFVGNLVAWGGESFAAPVIVMFASHVAGAIVFALFVACATEATRRWSGELAALVFPTLATAFYFALGAQSPHGTWGSPAYSQVDFVPLIQTASWLGMCGVMFIMSLLPSGLAVAWYRRRWHMDWKHPAMMAAGAFGLAVALGWIRVMLTPATPSVRVAMVAGNSMAPQSESGDVRDATAVIGLYAKLVRQAAGGGAQIVVMPEKTVGVAPSYEGDVVQGFQEIASVSHVWLVVGFNEIERTPRKNIAVVLGPDGEIIATYAKRHPVSDLEGDYEAGAHPAIFDAPWGRTAVLISQDLDFPGIARELAAKDVRVVMAPAADWAGSELTHQQMAVVRGVESGFSIARAARGGMVSANDSRGRQIAARAAVSGEDAIAIADLPLGTGATLYSRTDDWFGHLCVMFMILLMLRLGVSIWYAARMRRRATVNRVIPAGIVSVDVARPEEEGEGPEQVPAAQWQLDERRFYRVRTRAPDYSLIELEKPSKSASRGIFQATRNR